MESSLRQYSTSEEIANSITHGVGIILAIGALGILAATASLYGNIWHVISVSHELGFCSSSASVS